jgi:hypothetical protein
MNGDEVIKRWRWENDMLQTKLAKLLVLYREQPVIAVAHFRQRLRLHRLDL